MSDFIEVQVVLISSPLNVALLLLIKSGLLSEMNLFNGLSIVPVDVLDP